MISYGGDYVEILKGMVKDAGYPDEECNYVKIDDNTIYYFIKDYQLKNGNIIATNILKEAIGHAPYTSLGVIDQNDGKLLIPFENKTIKQIGDNLLLVEQNARMALNVAEHGFILETGSIIMKDRCENIKKNDMVRKAYLGL